MWIILDEGHITNIGVDPAYRRQGIGQASSTSSPNLVWPEVCAMTLEVRVSNAGHRLSIPNWVLSPRIRKEYYQDDKEDALIMWRELGEEWTNTGN